MLQQYQEIGVKRAIFGVPSAGRDTLLPILDNYATRLRFVTAPREQLVPRRDVGQVGSHHEPLPVYLGPRTQKTQESSLHRSILVLERCHHVPDDMPGMSGDAVLHIHRGHRGAFRCV